MEIGRKIYYKANSYGRDDRSQSDQHLDNKGYFFGKRYCKQLKWNYLFHSFIHSFAIPFNNRMKNVYLSIAYVRPAKKKKNKNTFLSMGKCEKQIRMNGSFYFENSSNITNVSTVSIHVYVRLLLLLLFLLLQIVVIRCNFIWLHLYQWVVGTRNTLFYIVYT